MIIRNRETQTETVRNQTVNALSVKAFLINSSGTPVSTDIDWSQVSVKIVLNRNGMQDIIMQDDLKKLGLASTVDTLAQYAFSTGTKTINSNLGSLIGFTIPFGGHINLKDNDFLFVEVTCLQNLYSSSAISATSYIETKLVKSVGYETFIPQIQSKVIQASESTRKFDLGDNVKRTVILNYDKTDFQNNVIDNLTITSDRYNENLTFADLVMAKVNSYGKQLFDTANSDLSANMQEDQCFVISDFHQHFNAMELDLKFQSAQVTASNNVIVYWTYRTDMTIIDKANRLQQKHAQKAIEAIPAKQTK